MAKNKLSIGQQGLGYKFLFGLTALLTILLILTIPFCPFMPWATLIMAVLIAAVCGVRARKFKQ